MLQAPERIEAESPSLLQIAIVSRAPLVASGLLSALSAVAEWQLAVHAEPLAAAAADALVLHHDAGDALPALPPGLPTVVLGDDLVEWSTLTEPRALALLAATSSAKQLRAALTAVLEGLSVREPRYTFAPAPLHAGTSSGTYSGDPGGDHEPLTPRELEVYELIGKGLTNRDIGGVLGISAHTAKYHVGQILAKVGAATRAEAVSAGLRMGIIGL